MPSVGYFLLKPFLPFYYICLHTPSEKLQSVKPLSLKSLLEQKSQNSPMPK
jgi:hypothetical protein